MERRRKKKFLTDVSEAEALQEEELREGNLYR